MLPSYDESKGNHSQQWHLRNALLTTRKYGDTVNAAHPHINIHLEFELMCVCVCSRAPRAPRRKNKGGPDTTEKDFIAPQNASTQEFIYKGGPRPAQFFGAFGIKFPRTHTSLSDALDKTPN